MSFSFRKRFNLAAVLVGWLGIASDPRLLQWNFPSASKAASLQLTVALRSTNVYMFVPHFVKLVLSMRLPDTLWCFLE